VLTVQFTIKTSRTITSFRTNDYLSIEPTNSSGTPLDNYYGFFYELFSTSATEKIIISRFKVGANGYYGFNIKGKLSSIATLYITDIIFSTNIDPLSMSNAGISVNNAQYYPAGTYVGNATYATGGGYVCTQEGLATTRTWAATTAYVYGDVVKPSGGSADCYRCIVGGTSASTAPSGTGTFVDGSVTWLYQRSAATFKTITAT
jgi:hypothetical protein